MYCPGRSPPAHSRCRRSRPGSHRCTVLRRPMPPQRWRRSGGAGDGNTPRRCRRSCCRNSRSHSSPHSTRSTHSGFSPWRPSSRWCSPRAGRSDRCQSSRSGSRCPRRWLGWPPTGRFRRRTGPPGPSGWPPPRPHQPEQAHLSIKLQDRQLQAAKYFLLPSASLNHFSTLFH